MNTWGDEAMESMVWEEAFSLQQCSHGDKIYFLEAHTVLKGLPAITGKAYNE